MHQLLEIQGLTDASERKTVKPKIVNKKIEEIKYTFTQLENRFLLSKKTSKNEIKVYKNFKDTQTQQEWQEELESLNQINQKLLGDPNNIYKFINTYKHNDFKATRLLKTTIKNQSKTELLPLLTKYSNGRDRKLVTQSNKIIESIDAAERQIMISTGITLIAAIISGIWSCRSILRQINQLKQTAEKIEKVNLDPRADVNSKDELERFTNVFNQMMDDLSASTVTKYYIDQTINSIADTLIVINPEATIIRINQAAIEFLGYAENELIGKPVNLIINADFYRLLELATLKEKNALANLNGVIANNEITYSTKDGRKIPVSFSASVMQDKWQRIQGIVCVAYDITQRKEAEKLNSLLVTAVDYAADAIKITDAQARFELVIILENARMEHFFIKKLLSLLLVM